MKIKKKILIVLSVFILILTAFVIIFFSRIKTIRSIEKLSDYSDFNIYRMEIGYDYDLDRIIESLTSGDSLVNAVIKEVIPFVPVSIKTPQFGCSAFHLNSSQSPEHWMMGRSYDFKLSTSSMAVVTHPKNGYASIAFAALDNLSANDPLLNLKTKLVTLAAPFACLDGINEKGVSIAVLVTGKKPLKQQTGKQVITTSIAIRLVLDKAASTEEAVKLLDKYDMHSTAGLDYHFYITDSKGDGRVVEYDPKTETHDMLAIPARQVTNFYMSQINEEGEKSGKDRYDRICNLLDLAADSCSSETVWEILKAVARGPKPNELTSHTQWSILFDNTNPSASIVLRRSWNDKYYLTIN